MVRIKVTSVEEFELKTPMKYLVNDEAKPLKTLTGKCEKCIAEVDGELFLVVHPEGEFRREGILYPIIGKFDEIEGEEVKIASAT